MAVVCNEETSKRRDRLIEEISSGEKRKDILLNDSFPFKTELQAIYFSHTRRNMESDMAHATMCQAGCTDDLKILEVLRDGQLSGYK